MTQRDLFNEEPPETRLNIVLEDEETAAPEWVTRCEVWSAQRYHPNVLLGILIYRDSAHDLMLDDLRHVADMWAFATRRDLIRWLTNRQSHLGRYQRKHAVAWLSNAEL